MITFVTVKDSMLSELKATNYANSAAIVKTNVSKTGAITHKIAFVSDLQFTQPIKVIGHVLKAILAEYRVNQRNVKAYGKLGDLTTGIKFASLINPLLNSTTLYRIDSDGKFKSVCTSDVPWNKTALKVNDKQLITYCNNAVLRSAIHNQAKAILAQSTYIRDVDAEFYDICKVVGYDVEQPDTLFDADYLHEEIDLDQTSETVATVTETETVTETAAKVTESETAATVTESKKAKTGKKAKVA